MRLATRSALIATTLAIAATTAANASAGTGVQQTGPWAEPVGVYSAAPAPSRGPLAGPWAGPLGVYTPVPHPASHGSAKPSPPIVRDSAPSNSFDYADAAIGAGGMAGLVLLGAAATLTVRRRGQLRRT
jgi:hypothetical protein